MDISYSWIINMKTHWTRFHFQPFVSPRYLPHTTAGFQVYLLYFRPITTNLARIELASCPNVPFISGEFISYLRCVLQRFNIENILRNTARGLSKIVKKGKIFFTTTYGLQKNPNFSIFPNHPRWAAEIRSIWLRQYRGNSSKRYS